MFKWNPPQLNITGWSSFPRPIAAPRDDVYHHAIGRSGQATTRVALNHRFAVQGPFPIDFTRVALALLGLRGCDDTSARLISCLYPESGRSISLRQRDHPETLIRCCLRMKSGWRTPVQAGRGALPSVSSGYPWPTAVSWVHQVEGSFGTWYACRFTQGVPMLGLYPPSHVVTGGDSYP